ncbi:hypothetical protein K5P26_13310 [Sphingopyxis sp. XHP0097]|uniref:Uncharacterized protein n=1 Tax=Sphingopyxis jiangsuensis TaxID=2871171 RepID=A0ABS7MHD9_9SPHN|nr:MULTISPECIES: hypothetical protein [Sphingopyxis]MBL0768771.1 hypothetical protein [Sphingopyxis lutea]MBY4638119.1 hypothetical protein [Sphingopyxis jiangsuensis]
MKTWTTLAAILAVPAGVAAAAVPYHAMPAGFERPEIRSVPIAGIKNQYWFNYQADILEAEKELVSDLRRATDREDRWDAWDEWANEIVDADKDYVKEMRKKGYRAGRVTVG